MTGIRRGEPHEADAAEDLMQACREPEQTFSGYGVSVIRDALEKARALAAPLAERGPYKRCVEAREAVAAIDDALALVSPSPEPSSDPNIKET